WTPSSTTPNSPLTLAPSVDHAGLSNRRFTDHPPAVPADLDGPPARVAQVQVNLPPVLRKPAMDLVLLALVDRHTFQHPEGLRHRLTGGRLPHGAVKGGLRPGAHRRRAEFPRLLVPIAGYGRVGGAVGAVEQLHPRVQYQRHQPIGG